MGMKKSETACPYDNACWATGQTPKYLICSIYGVEKETPNPSQPDPPNGMVNLEQVDAHHWTAYKDGWTYTLTYDTNKSWLEVVSGGFWTGFGILSNENCQFIFVQTVSGTYYKNGVAVIGWFGPSMSESAVRDLISDLGLAGPEKVQAEQYGTRDNKTVTRLANHYDGTKVYIKQSE